MEVYKTYPNMMNKVLYLSFRFLHPKTPDSSRQTKTKQSKTTTQRQRIGQQFAVSNPFDFKHIRYLKNEDPNEAEPCVVMASPECYRMESLANFSTGGALTPEMGSSSLGTVSNKVLQRFFNNKKYPPPHTLFFISRFPLPPLFDRE